MSTASHLEKLNGPQRKAVTYGETLAEGRQGRAVAHRRRCGHRQDEHARAPRGAPHHQWRRSGAHPHAHVHASRGHRDAPARARHREGRAERAARRRQPHDFTAAHLGRHVPLDRQPPAAPLRTSPEARSAVHRRGSRGFRGPHGHRAHGAGLREQGAAVSRARKPACRSTPTA